MAIKTTYKRTEKITRYTISTSPISHNNSLNEHSVHVSLSDGRSIKIPKGGSYQIHTSGVLEVNVQCSATFYAAGEWSSLKDTNLTKLLKYFQDLADNHTGSTISLS
jgi:hypothetical protein